MVRRKIIMKILGVLFVCAAVLFWSGQNPFPGLEAKLSAKHKTTASVVVKERDYKTYLLLSEHQLFQTTFKRGLFWGENVNYFLSRSKPITINYLSLDEEQYSIIYGCRNDERIAFVELVRHNGEKIPLELSEDGIFCKKMQWSAIKEVCAYDSNGNLVYQQFLNSARE